MSELYERIYAIVRRIPPGRAATYGQIALLAGNPRLSRVVGYALHKAPPDVPCHRVVDRNGRTAPAFRRYGDDLQRMMLEEEGAAFTPDGRVDLSRSGWAGE
ncbi:MAG TPA: MGMT family protein [Candidatus Merdivicinus intestinavium]|nr:MGMT family protein [Candidatus Merdivicinus intestinavium]